MLNENQNITLLLFIQKKILKIVTVATQSDVFHVNKQLPINIRSLSIRNLFFFFLNNFIKTKNYRYNIFTMFID